MLDLVLWANYSMRMSCQSAWIIRDYVLKTHSNSSLLRPTCDDGMRPHGSQGLGCLVPDAGVATSDDGNLSGEVHCGVGETGTHFYWHAIALLATPL